MAFVQKMKFKPPRPFYKIQTGEGWPVIFEERPVHLDEYSEDWRPPSQF